MSDFNAVISASVQCLGIPFTIFGFTFSFWEVLITSLVLSFVVWLVSSFWR